MLRGCPYSAALPASLPSPLCLPARTCLSSSAAAGSEGPATYASIVRKRARGRAGRAEGQDHGERCWCCRYVYGAAFLCNLSASIRPTRARDGAAALLGCAAAPRPAGRRAVRNLSRLGGVFRVTERQWVCRMCCLSAGGGIAQSRSAAVEALSQQPGTARPRSGVVRGTHLAAQHRHLIVQMPHNAIEQRRLRSSSPSGTNR
jgi:hypothetical protein